MAGQFEIYKDGAGQFRWRLKMLSVIDSADDGVVGVADDRDVSRPRRLVAGGAWSSG